jgi:hypothetical protein
MCQTPLEENDGTLPSSFSSLQHHHKKIRQHIAVVFFFSNIEKTKHTKKQPKKLGRSLPSSSRSALSLLAIASTLPLLHFHFKCFLFASSSSQAKEKENTKEKKNHREEKLRRERKELTSSSHFALSLLATASNLPLLHFCFKCFLLASSSSKAEEEKKKTQRKKIM